MILLLFEVIVQHLNLVIMVNEMEIYHGIMVLFYDLIYENEVTIVVPNFKELIN